MDRLTKRTARGKPYYPPCFDRPKCDGKGYSKRCNRCDVELAVCERLAAYEDTGLTPEEVVKVNTFAGSELEKQLGKYLRLQAAHDAMRQEWQEAHDELGRLRKLVTDLLKSPDDDICAYCANQIPCRGKDCDWYVNGKGGTIDGREYPDFQWTCEDFEHGSCPKLSGTPCEGCCKNDYRGFVLREEGKNGH